MIHEKVVVKAFLLEHESAQDVFGLFAGPAGHPILGREEMS